MKELLETDFINHYNRHPELPVETNIIHYSVNDIDFEIKDETGKKDSAGNDIYGMAKYSNPNQYRINIIEYEKFIKSLPARVKNTNAIGKDVCDYIVYSENQQYFLLNELTNTAPKFINEYENLKGKQEGKLVKAQRQLKCSLENVIKVPTIHTYIRQFIAKQCCFFNSYSEEITEVNAEQAFNQLDNIEYFEPSKLSSPEIEAFGFEFWVFSGNQIYLLEDNSYKSKIRK